MFEMHSGTRPGRPKLLTVLCAAALVGTLGLAWLQVRDSRALGDVVRLGGGSGRPALVVRPPAGWRQLPSDPWTFVEIAEIGGGDEVQIERRITFRYQRWPYVQPLDDLLGKRNLIEGVAGVADHEAARVGGLFGVQVRRLRVFRFRNLQEMRESMYRLAISPRGDEVNIEYHPVRELTAGELDLLEAVANAVRIDDPLLHTSPSAAMRQAGLTLRPRPTWHVFGPDLEAVPGFYVQSVQGGVPRWAVGVFRTWLADQRSASDLLTDFGLREWQTLEGADPPQRLDVDGREVLLLRKPPGRPHAIAGGCLVVESPERAALLVLYAGAQQAQAVEQAAREIAADLEFAREGFPDLRAATDDGAALARRVRADYADWWGREPRVLHYRGDQVMPPDYRERPMVLAIQRAPAVGRPGAYDGVEQALRPDALEETAWRLENGGTGYEWRSMQQDRRRRPAAAGGALRITETRAKGGGEVTRVLSRDGRAHRTRFAVGQAYVCPPLGTVSELLVARGYPEQALVEISNPRGLNTMTRLLRPLPPDSDGRRRVHILDDCDPRGAVVAFGEDAEIDLQFMPGTRFERITPDEALRLRQAIGG